MNKPIANTLFGLCLTLSVFITYKAIEYASSFAFSGKQPVAWLNIIAFLLSIVLVLAGIIIKIKVKK